jgi:hypothetical protein
MCPAILRSDESRSDRPSKVSLLDESSRDPTQSHHQLILGTFDLIKSLIQKFIRSSAGVIGEPQDN